MLLPAAFFSSESIIYLLQLCESQRDHPLVDLGTEPKRVEIVNFQPFEDDESKGQDLTSSPTNTLIENRSVCGECNIF